MKNYTMKHVVVGIMLVILTLGFCVVGTGAARPDMPPMDQQGFGHGGQGRPMGGQDFDGETPPEMPDGESDGFCPRDGSGENDGGQPPADGGFGFDHQRGFGGHGGPGRDGKGMDGDVREAIEALEDEDTRAALETLLENVRAAMEALMSADEDKREEAEAAVKEARDALNEALTAAGIDVSVSQPPEKPEGADDMTPPEKPDGDMPFDGKGGMPAADESESSKT